MYMRTLFVCSINNNNGIFNSNPFTINSLIFNEFVLLKIHWNSHVINIVIDLSQVCGKNIKLGDLLVEPNGQWSQNYNVFNTWLVDVNRLF